MSSGAQFWRADSASAWTDHADSTGLVGLAGGDEGAVVEPVVGVVAEQVQEGGAGRAVDGVGEVGLGRWHGIGSRVRAGRQGLGEHSDGHRQPALTGSRRTGPLRPARLREGGARSSVTAVTQSQGAGVLLLK